MNQLDDFTRAYIECALWSSTDASDRPLDENWSIDDLADTAIERMVLDCQKFQADNAEWITWENSQSPYPYVEIAGHDFWLTRNGHGAGFWDGDWTEPAATKLTESSKAFGECNLYVGDDGELYIT